MNSAAPNDTGIVDAEPLLEPFGYRSEAFAEDLFDDDEPTLVTQRTSGGWLYAAPLSAALVGAALSLLQQVA
jgi:hypothetical protein